MAIRNILACRTKTFFGDVVCMDAKQVTRAQQIAEFVSDILDMVCISLYICFRSSLGLIKLIYISFEGG